MFGAKARKFYVPKRIEIFDAQIQAMLNVIDWGEREFEATVRTWDHEVIFQKEIRVLKTRIIGIVWTDDEIYGYVDKGTKPHKIRPKKATILAFPETYLAKTAINLIGSGSGGSSGDTVFAKEVDHPGNDPRNFSKIIRDYMQELMAEEMKRTMRKTKKMLQK